MANSKGAKSNNLKPIAQTTMADQVEVKLFEFFKSEGLSEGDAVPKETELAESLGVSRNVVREALSRLRMLGMVETRKKRGMILGRPDLFGGLERLLDPDVLDRRTINEIFEMRLVIEMGLANLLFLRKTDQDIKELEGLIEKNERLSPSSRRLQGEVDFHKKLYEIAGNDTLHKFQTMLLPLFKYVSDLESQEGGKIQKAKVTHTDLVEILKKGSADDYRLAICQHLEPHIKRLKTKN